MTDRGLESALTALGRAVEYPPEPAVAAAVRARIEAGAPARVPWPERVWLKLRRPAFAAAAAVVIAAGAVLVTPPAREAVADWLGFDDVRVTFDEPPVPPAGEDLFLGTPVSLSEARSRVDFDVRVPAELGAPDEVYYSPIVSNGQVSLVYRERSALPASVGTDVGALVTQFEASFLRNDFYEKFVRPSTNVVETTVNGVPALWIDQPHSLIYRGADGVVANEDSRLSGPSLVWEEDGMLLRLESRLDLDRAIEVAESLE
jgi:hypothetical protein